MGSEIHWEFMPDFELQVDSVDLVGLDTSEYLAYFGVSKIVKSVGMFPLQCKFQVFHKNCQDFFLMHRRLRFAASFELTPIGQYRVLTRVTELEM